MEIKQISEGLETWETKSIELWNGASYRLTISTMYKENRRRYIKRLTRLQEDTEVLMTECYINEIDLNGHEFSSFNPEDYVHRELFNAGYLDKADFRNYESKEN